MYTQRRCLHARRPDDAAAAPTKSGHVHDGVARTSHSYAFPVEPNTANEECHVPEEGCVPPGLVVA